MKTLDVAIDLEMYHAFQFNVKCVVLCLALQ